MFHLLIILNRFIYNLKLIYNKIIFTIIIDKGVNYGGQKFYARGGSRS
jgi:hypothetical protein